MEPKRCEVSPQRKRCEVRVSHSDDTQQAQQAESIWLSPCLRTSLLLATLVQKTASRAHLRMQVLSKQQPKAVTLAAQSSLLLQT